MKPKNRRKIKLNWKIYWREELAKTAQFLDQKKIIYLIICEFKKGNYPANYRMPSIRTLADYWKIDIRQVGRAYSSLVKLNFLTSVPRVGYFVEKSLQEPDELQLQEPEDILLPINTPKDNSAEDPFALNTLTIGYGKHRFHHRAYAEAVVKRPPAVKFEPIVSYADFISRDVFKLLKSKKYIYSVGQLCVMPEELTFPMVLQLITNPGEHIAMVSSGDGRLSNALIQMGRKPVFTGLDAEGMCLAKLQDHFENYAVKAVIVRRHEQYPYSVQLTESRYHQLLELCARHNIWLVFEDVDHLQYQSHGFNPRIMTKRVVYLSSRRYLHEYYNAGIVCGPLKLIKVLREAVYPILQKWEDYSERHSFFAFVIERIQKQFKSATMNRNAGQKPLVLAFKNHLKSPGELVIPKAGQFATIVFQEAIPAEVFSLIGDNKLFHRSENLLWKPDQPVKVLRINLAISDWAALRGIFEIIRNK